MPPEPTPFSAEARAALECAVTQARRWLRTPAPDSDSHTEAEHAPSVLLAGGGLEATRRAAQQLAHELGRDLYRVDVGSLVSKFIGETEKNLDRALETAERTGAVLLFDESDALFGGRTGVRDSHDRYAAVDVDYLQRRLAAFPGLAILACRKSLHELGGAARRFGCVIELHQASPQR